MAIPLKNHRHTHDATGCETPAARHKRRVAELKLAREAIANIEKMLAGDASEGVKKSKIASPNGMSREIEMYSMGELLEHLRYWRKRASDLELSIAGKRAPNIRYAI